jgi:hypothetical protein
MVIILLWRLGPRFRGSIFPLVVDLLVNAIHYLLSLTVFVDLGLFLFHMLCCCDSESGFTRGSSLYLQWVWQGQVHPGRLQSLCRSLSLEGSAQNEEVSGGQVPRGYPRQEVPVGSGDVSGMCLTTDIRIPSVPTQDRPVCSRMITFLVIVAHAWYARGPSRLLWRLGPVAWCAEHWSFTAGRYAAHFAVNGRPGGFEA